MTPGHEEFIATLADYAGSRLDPEQRRAVEAHLSECRECEEIVADLKEMAEHIKAGGEAMFEPHPDTATLRRHASSGEGSDPRIRRHLELCAQCSLEAKEWERRGKPAVAGWTDVSKPGRSVPLLRLGLAAAVGVVLGLLVGAPFYRSRTAIPTTPREEPPQVQAPEPPIGQPVLHLLPGMLRSGGVPRQEWTLSRSDPYLAVAVPVSIPAAAGDSERYRFEVRDPSGATAWSLELSVARIREHLDASEAVNIPAIPTRSIAAGTYEFLVRPASPPDAPPIYHASITISYRQSPADTNPAQ